MKAVLLTVMLLITPLSWADQQTPKEQAKEMAEAICLSQYELIHSRFTLGHSERESMKASSDILKTYLEKKKEKLGDHSLSLISKDVIAQLREIEANPDAVQQLKSPPLDFKDKFLSSCLDRKTEQLEFMHVFG